MTMCLLTSFSVRCVPPAHHRHCFGISCVTTTVVKRDGKIEAKKGSESCSDSPLDGPDADFLGMGQDPAAVRHELSMIDQVYTEGVTLNQIPHSILTDLRRALKIPQKITTSTMSHFGVVGVSGRDGLIFPRYVFRQGEGSPQQPSGIRVTRLHGNSISEENLPRSRFAGYFGYHLINEDMKEVILCANDIDALSVYQDSKRPVISLPRMSADHFQDALPYLDQFVKVVIWFPPDAKSFERGRRIAARIGQSRCHFIRPNSKFPSPTEWFATGKSVQVALEEAEPLLSKAVETFEHLRASVADEFLQKDQRIGVRWRRFPRLNACLKGFRLGELTIMTGPTGSGKTTFASEYALDLCEQGVNTLWACFDGSNTKLAKMMMLQFARLELEKQPESKFDYWADKFDRLPMFFMRFTGAASSASYIEAIKTAITTHEIHHVVLDNIQTILGNYYSGDVGENASQQDRLVDSFRQMATTADVHVTMILHPKHEFPYEEITISSIFGGVRAAQAADNVMVIQQIAIDQQPFIKRYLQVSKEFREVSATYKALDVDDAVFSITKFPMRTFSSPRLRRLLSDQYEQCPICLEEFQTKTVVRQLSCRHVFCRKCIDKFVNTSETNRSCPVCRQSLEA